MRRYDNPFDPDLKFAIPITLIMWALLIWVMLSVSGCAALVPNYVAPELEHMSHATQHEPLTDHPTEYGANLANVVVGYNLPHHVNFELAEGVSLDRHYPQQQEWGEIAGPREEFSARVRYVFEIHQ